METIREIVGLVGIVFGLFFYTAGIIGLVRFPDVYMRIHAAGKVSALGILGFSFGAAVLMPASTLKILALGIFMFVTQPVSSHATAQAAYRNRVSLDNLVQDDLDGKIEYNDVKSYDDVKEKSLLSRLFPF